MNYKTIAYALTMTLLLSTGCTTEDIHSNLRVDPAPLSEFLPNHKLLVRQPDTFPFHFFYLDQNASVYENIFIADADISLLKKSTGWAAFDEALGGTLGVHIDNLCNYMHDAYVRAFNKQDEGKCLKVVTDRNLPKTLVLEPAIIAVRPTKAELQIAGIASSLVIPGIGLVTSQMSSGAITVECRIKDAKTGKIVAMYADTERDPDAVLQMAKLTWTHSTRINVKTIAEQTAAVLAAKDYKTIKRDFPIRFVTLIKDASLED